jgi:hypothetical protein
VIQNWDQAPNLVIPAPWSTSVAGSPGDPAWVLDATTPDTTPLSAFTDDRDHITDKLLVSPSFPVTSSPNQALVIFYQRFQLETTYDGAVLEISINGGAFTDIVTAGGTFTTGGYTGVIDTGFGSPIAGRSAWTGESPGYPGYMQTVAKLPLAAANQSIRLRWRVATDTSVPSTGQNIDTIQVVDDYPSMACVGQPAPIPQEVGTILAQPDKFTYTFPPALGASDYDALRGLTPFLPVGPGGGDEACGASLGGPAFTDGSNPPLGTAYWYIARGKNSCGVGTWGRQSNGTPRTTTTCP